MLVLVLILSTVVGIALGLLGGGGSILTVPILDYVAGFSAKQAIAASLFVVGVTSAVGAVAHARAGRVRWRTGLLFGAAAMVGAFVGGRLAAYLSGTALMTMFAVMMAATAVAMLRPSRALPRAVGRELPVAFVLVEGVVVGAVTGMVGAGGGFLVVPALVLLGGLPMDAAVGTSLVVIALKSFAGLAGHLGHVSIDWWPTLAVTGAAVAGVLAGGRFAGRVPPASLRRAFGIFIVVMACVVMAAQLV